MLQCMNRKANTSESSHSNTPAVFVRNITLCVVGSPYSAARLCERACKVTLHDLVNRAHCSYVW